MEALLLTVGVLALIGGGLYLFTRAMPRGDGTARVRGYRAHYGIDGNERPDPDTRDVQEDDDPESSESPHK